MTRMNNFNTLFFVFIYEHYFRIIVLNMIFGFVVIFSKVIDKNEGENMHNWKRWMRRKDGKDKKEQKI